MNKIYFLLIALPILSIFVGCSQSLLTLINISREQKSQAVFIAEQDKKFEILIKDITSGSLNPKLTQRDCINRYGQPITQKQRDGQTVLLYRRQRDFFPSEKAYLYFDKDGFLSKWEHIQ